MKSPVNLRHVLVGELADLPEVDEPDSGAALHHEDVRGMRVAVEEPVAEDHRHPRLGDPVGEVCDAPPGSSAATLRSAELHSLEQLEHEHAPAGVAPVDPRDLARPGWPAKLRRKISAFRASAR